MFTNLFAKHNVVRRTGLLISTLLIVTLSSRAQQVRVSDLLHYLQTPVSEFETCMLRQGFVCYRSTGNLWGWTCLFAYQPTHLLTQPEQASAIIQYDRNNRSDIILYQLRSPQQYLALQKELATLGFRMESALGDYCIFSQGNTIVTCREVDKSNGISGNYGGYSISMVRRHY